MALVRYLYNYSSDEVERFQRMYNLRRVSLNVSILLVKKKKKKTRKGVCVCE